MKMIDLLEKKKQGLPLSKEEIDFFVEGYTKGEIPDYQASALLMAIYLKKMNKEETANLTLAMAHSGDVLNLSQVEGIKIDKHSTGGVGDTTTLVVAPMVAALGIPVAKMSGRGLGHTGGTIDKLESFSGFSVEMSEKEFIHNVNTIKVSVIGQTKDLAPADKKLYALRDVTSTVNDISLISSSIMSKKIAAGADCILLDVKVGDGAFMKTHEDAKALALEMVEIGKNIGRDTVAIISDMDQPLGYAIGNALEVKEAIDTLKGNGPEDLFALCLEIGANMVVLAKKANTKEEAIQKLKETITTGAAFEKFKDFITAQGGSKEQVENPELLPGAQYQVAVESPLAGYVTKIKAQNFGNIALELGAGRKTKEDAIDLGVGIVLAKKRGDQVVKGETLATIYANDLSKIDEAKKQIIENYLITEERPQELPLIYEVIG